MTSGKKHVREEHSNSSRHNNTYTPSLHFHTAAVHGDLSQRREQQLIKKFESRILCK